MNVEFHPSAVREVEEAQAWYEERSLFAASAFLREMSIAVRRLRETPALYPLAEAGTRRMLLDRFPYTIYYRIESQTLTIVAVAHQKRRPGYWSSR
jgi:plasmid stabilization system protein ParE